ncbi:hypothetical protein [Micromonospora craniellae]|uniref:Uncharacterized protein n=1 Tax=Micromonospora craniellae TaxID=2294034 RepID=A0A372G2B5_9ACTN|nr:hypothetical protein [Micromonospora craniellae]QOC92768.1 hypothetical protein ID554_03145 [Micromonospora craniellae]RFS46916.1 hypothetical protein D0Q02_09050 [Micromonospora craniellae]
MRNPSRTAYAAAVAAAAGRRAGYVLAAGAPADRRLRELLGDRPERSLLAEIGGFRVYHPPEPLRPWR